VAGVDLHGAAEVGQHVVVVHVRSGLARVVADPARRIPWAEILDRAGSWRRFYETISAEI
jgi:hypothetical protein